MQSSAFLGMPSAYGLGLAWAGDGGACRVAILAHSNLLSRRQGGRMIEGRDATGFPVRRPGQALAGGIPRTGGRLHGVR